jgi:hypothetical protein
LDLGLSLSILDFRDSPSKDLPPGELPRHSLDTWRKSPPYPRLRILHHKHAEVRLADGAILFTFEYGSLPFTASALLAEKNKKLARFQVFGTYPRIKAFGSSTQEILSSFHF